ncbi:MAG: hypothetical protein IPO88_24305 [Nannocystis sp.]|uniref:hypothetical protein n=1 Tax=Nannocystis sp. TaxID=1962667 RepID=UPI002426CBCA|nr:hypothetical protein [Nannocystis sp.]MBK9756563.1 hypothetical protein [Nannocystis sp.]
MRVRSCGLLTPVCLFSVIACGEDPVATSETTSASTTAETTAATTAETTTAAPTTTAEPPTTSDTPTTAASTGEAPEPPAIARGIRLTRVTATQGVQTEIVRDGLELPPEDYAVALISRRKTVLRADWSLHASFVPRELLARLTLYTPEGETHVDEYKALVEGPSNDGDFTRTFRWQLPAELVRPGMEYRIEAFEADPEAASGEVSDPPPILPLAGRGKLVVEDNPMVIKVELIPVKHVFDGMTCMPTITDDDVLDMQKWMEQHNAVERAELTVAEPMEYTESIGTAEEGFVPVLTALGIHRAKVKPAANVYWYGLLQSCDAYPIGLLGQAYGIPEAPTVGLAFQRIATGRYLGSGADARDTFVHEVGHSQGRYHIRCSGGEAGTDPDYPHPNGRIGVWGYGIHDTQLRSPTGYRDYMTYCDNSFVSDYGWDLTYGFIKELSSWDMAGAPAEDAPLLVGTLHSDGSATWWTTRGSAPQRGRSSDTRVEFAIAGETITLPASVGEIPDSSAQVVAAPLPPRWAEVDALRLVVAGQLRHASPRAAVRELHAAP